MVISIYVPTFIFTVNNEKMQVPIVCTVNYKKKVHVLKEFLLMSPNSGQSLLHQSHLCRRGFQRDLMITEAELSYLPDHELYREES